MTENAGQWCRRFIAVFAIAVVQCAGVGCVEQEQATDAPILRPVRAIAVTSNDGQRERTFSGTSQSSEESRLSFKVSGTVIDLPIQVGDQLPAGAVIGRLDPSTFDLEVQQNRANLVQVQANQRNAEANYSRVRGLYENNNASRNDLDTARANAEAARAQARAAQKSLEIAQLNNSYTRLQTTKACSVASVDVELNENVTAGTPIARVNCGTGVEIRLGVPESLIAGIEQGMTGEVIFNVFPDTIFTGTVTEIGVATGGAAATFPVIVSIDKPDKLIRPGLAAEVTFAFGPATTTPGFYLPSSAIINDEQGTFVYLAEAINGSKEAIIQRRAVVLGELTQNGIEVIEGLSEGDVVVTAGTSMIRPQQHVLLP